MSNRGTAPGAGSEGPRQKKFRVYHVIICALIGFALFVAAAYLTARLIRPLIRPTKELSERTASVVKNLPRPVSITYWDRAAGFAGARELLDSYSALSRRIDVRYLDPDANSARAKAAGVKVYGTVVVEVDGRRQVARSLTEAGVTGAIMRAVTPRERTACFAAGSGESEISDTERQGFSTSASRLREDGYKVVSIGLSEKPEIPNTCSVLVVGGPTRDYDQAAVNAIERFMDDGGNALFMLEPALKAAPHQVDDNEALLGLLGSWGVIVNKDLVMDLSGAGSLFGVGPENVVVEHFASHPVTLGLGGFVLFSAARSLEVRDGERARLDKLVSTSEKSCATTKIGFVEIKLDGTERKGPLLLAVAGTLSGKTSGKGRFAVVGDSTWATNVLMRPGGNSDLFLNTMRWLFSDEDVPSAPPKHGGRQ